MLERQDADCRSEPNVTRVLGNRREQNRRRWADPVRRKVMFSQPERVEPELVRKFRLREGARDRVSGSLTGGWIAVEDREDVEP